MNGVRAMAADAAPAQAPAAPPALVLPGWPEPGPPALGRPYPGPGPPGQRAPGRCPPAHGTPGPGAGAHRAPGHSGRRRAAVAGPLSSRQCARSLPRPPCGRITGPRPVVLCASVLGASVLGTSVRCLLVLCLLVSGVLVLWLGLLRPAPSA